MRRFLYFAAALGLVLLVATCAHRAPAPGKALVEHTLRFDDRDRHYLLMHPASAGAHPPLVLGLHGRMGTGAGHDSLTHLSALAETEGFVLALPDGIDRSWHDARENGPAADQGIDDVGFLKALIAQLVATEHADPSRVFVFGMSNGAFMALTLACRAPDVVRGVAAVTGLISQNQLTECATGAPFSVVFIEGTDDPLVPFDGGQVAGKHGAVLSAADSFSLMTQRNGCAGAEVLTTIAENPKDDGTSTTLRAIRACTAQHSVGLFTVRGGGHTWPGGWQYLGEWIIGRTSRDFDASKSTWDFLTH